MNLKRFFTCLMLVSLFGIFVNSAAFAGARLSVCQPLIPGGTTGTGLDGSNCDAGLICGDAKICTYTTEVGCTGTIGCGIGQRCMDANNQVVNGNTAGTCQVALNGSTENNAIGDILCNAYKVATGKIGRGIIVVVLFVTGISFYLGKVQWGTIVAIVIGAGLCFGGPAIVSVLVGKNFLC